MYSVYRHGWVRTLFFLALLLMIPFVSGAKEDHLALDELATYYQQDGMYWRYCGTTQTVGQYACEMTLNITKRNETTNATTAFSAHEQNATNSSHWYYIPFNQYIANFTIYEENDLGNGTMVWSSLTSNEARNGIMNATNDTTQRRKYTWTQNTTKIDLIPQYYVTNSENYTYDEYAVFLDFDLDTGDLVYYSSMENETAIVTTNAVENLGSGFPYFYSGFLAADIVRDGIDVGGNRSAVDMGGAIGTNNFRGVGTNVPNAIFSNDEITFSYWGRPHAGRAISTIYRIKHVDRLIQFQDAANGSVVLRVEADDFAATNHWAYQPYTDEEWHQEAFTIESLGSNVHEFKLYRNGVLYSGVNYTIGSQLFGTSCTSGGECFIGQPSSPAANYDADIDEIRIYNRTLLNTEIADLANLVLLAGNVSSAPTFNETRNNETLNVGNTLAFTGNWSGDNDADWTSNDTRFTINTNNATQTATISYTNTIAETIHIEYRLFNGDGESRQNATYAFITVNASPTFNETRNNESLFTGDTLAFTGNWSATNDADWESNDTRLTINTNNATQTATISYTNAAAETLHIEYTLSNGDGETKQNATYTFTDPTPPTFDEATLPHGNFTTGTTITFTGNWTASRASDWTANDTRFTINTDNSTQTASVTYINSIQETVYVEYKISNGDGFDAQNVTYAFFDAASWDTEASDTEPLLDSSFKFTIGYTSEGPVNITTNDTTFTITDDPFLSQMNVSMNTSTLGAFIPLFTVSNTFGSATTSATYTVIAAPIDTQNAAATTIRNLLTGVGSGLGLLLGFLGEGIFELLLALVIATSVILFFPAIASRMRGK